MRLDLDDRYDGADTADMRKPTAGTQAPDKKSIYRDEGKSISYQESDDKYIASSMRWDDFEVFIRHTSYENKINHQVQKLIS